MNIPNILTLIRMFLIPLFILVFFSNLSNNLIVSILIFLIAGLTDILDGYIARSYNLVTRWGIVLDPLADKLMLITVLSCLVIKSYIPLWILIIVSCKELFMIIAGIFLYNKDVIIPSNALGKFATIAFYLSIVILYFNQRLGHYFIYTAVIITLIALINYFVSYFKTHKHTK